MQMALTCSSVNVSPMIPRWPDVPKVTAITLESAVIYNNNMRNKGKKQVENLGKLVQIVKGLIDRGTPRQYHQLLQTYHEADIAEALEELGVEETTQFFKKVTPDEAADILEKMEPVYQIESLLKIKAGLAAQFLEERQIEPFQAVSGPIDHLLIQGKEKLGAGRDLLEAPNLESGLSSYL